jgi:hypothetical protein
MLTRRRGASLATELAGQRLLLNIYSSELDRLDQLLRATPIIELDAREGARLETPDEREHRIAQANLYIAGQMGELITRITKTKQVIAVMETELGSPRRSHDNPDHDSENKNCSSNRTDNAAALQARIDYHQLEGNARMHRLNEYVRDVGDAESAREAQRAVRAAATLVAMSSQRSGMRLR